VGGVQCPHYFNFHTVVMSPVQFGTKQYVVQTADYRNKV
jgi:hypothetical protein